MDRRKFLYGIGGSAIGGSALVGSGAFSRIRSQRDAKIKVAADPDAYLGLDRCPDSPNSSYIDPDFPEEETHLAIDMSKDNATDGGGQGVNSDSFTYFDNLFQICNQGKEAVGVWIEATPRNPTSELKGDDEYGDYEDEDRVIFYNTDDPDARIDSRDDAYVLEVGECKCIGMRVMTKGLEEGDHLLEDDEIVINADADVSGTPAKPAEDFVTIGRMRGGDGGGAATWETAIASPTSAGVGTGQEDATGDANWTINNTNSFEFSFDGDNTYTLSVRDEDEDEELSSIDASGLAAPEANSQFRLQLRGSADGAVELESGALNNVDLGTLRDDDESFPNVTIATENLSEAFSVSGEFVFEGIESDERPAIDIQVEE